MKQFNVTAQIYKKTDQYRQTILVNELVHADDPNLAELVFKIGLEPQYALVKIYSVEEICQVAS